MGNTPKTLLAKLQQIIRFSGSITIADFMHICMADPEFGYYKNQQVLGAKGDFVTAPEISQIFGELIGIWAIDTWQKLGKPSPFCLAELGPGNGTMMKDILRVAKTNVAFFTSAKIYLVESSQNLIANQKAALNHAINDGSKLQWISDIAELPPIPTILIANEFLDAIPFRQYIKKGSAWLELGIGIDKNNQLLKCPLPTIADPGQLPVNADKQQDGTIFETAPAREAVVETICENLTRHSGAALLIDYGHLQTGFGDTFQALKNHQFSDPLSHLGQSDLTSHIDFERLSVCLKNYKNLSSNTTTQGEFLLKMGLLERAGLLGQNKSAKIQEEITIAVERLAAPDQMGDLFKVMAISTIDTRQASLAGF